MYNPFFPTSKAKEIMMSESYEELESRCQMLESENKKLKFGFADGIQKWIDRNNSDKEMDPHSVKFMRVTSKRGKYCAVLEDNEGTETYGYGDTLLSSIIDAYDRVKTNQHA